MHDKFGKHQGRDVRHEEGAEWDEVKKGRKEQPYKTAMEMEIWLMLLRTRPQLNGLDPQKQR